MRLWGWCTTTKTFTSTLIGIGSHEQLEQASSHGVHSLQGQRGMRIQGHQGGLGMTIQQMEEIPTQQIRSFENKPAPISKTTREEFQGDIAHETETLGRRAMQEGDYKEAETLRKENTQSTNSQFEETIRELTRPINGQLPRPWMTAMENPLEADVFIVGMNQRHGYPAGGLPHQRHLNALFNRNGENCRSLYDEVTEGRPSPTRRNIDGLVDSLKRQGISNILETDVVCYSTPMSAALKDRTHSGGARRGEEIFDYILAEIAPAVLIVHGVGSLKRVSRILKTSLLKVPDSAGEVCNVQTERHLVISIPSLAPPEFNKWASWSDGYLETVADLVRAKLEANR